METDAFGTRMKGYEAASTSRKAVRGEPIIVRLDGKGFHTFCKGLEKPFDARLHRLMVSVTTSLVQRFSANFGYTQSDEITIGFYIPEDSDADYIFNGRFQKLESLMAAHASSVFNRDLQTYLPEKGAELALFDCRGFTLPSIVEAYNTVLWRQMDCTKNAISMAAQANFTHKSLQGLSGLQMKAKLLQEKQINFDVAYLPAFRYGTFVQKETTEHQIKDEYLKFAKDPERRFFRSEYKMWSDRLLGLSNPIEFLFNGEKPCYKENIVQT